MVDCLREYHGAAQSGLVPHLSVAHCYTTLARDGSHAERGQRRDMPLFPWRRQAQPADEEPATLDLIFTEIKARLQESATQGAVLETKAGFVLTAASLLITGATGAQVAVASRQTHHVIDIDMCGKQLWAPS